MRQSIHFVAVIRQLAVSACVAIEVVERFAVVALLGSVRPCYVGNSGCSGTLSSDPLSRFASPEWRWHDRPGDLRFGLSSLKPRMSAETAFRRRDRYRCDG